jgi:hypothetical protein
MREIRPEIYTSVVCQDILRGMVQKFLIVTD